MAHFNAPGSYIAIPDAESLHFTNGFSLECWARIDSFGNRAILIGKSNPVAIYYQLSIDSLQRLTGTCYLLSGEQTVISPAITDIRVWHHYVFIFKPSDSLYLNIDGVEVASRKVTPSSIISSFDSVKIGDPVDGFLGSIDEVRLWSVALSTDQINKNLYSTISPNLNGLAAYYPLDDPTRAMRIHDFSRHGHDGLLQQGASIVPSSSPVQGQAVQGFSVDTKEYAISFGTVRCNPYFDTAIDIRNVGSEPIQINSVGFFRGEAFNASAPQTFSLPADSNVYHTVRLHFHPPHGGSFIDTLFISSPDACGGILKIGLSGVYDSVGLGFTSDTLRLGKLLNCELPVQRPVTIRNPSPTDTMIVLSAQVTGGLTGKVLTFFPDTLAPGSSTTINVQVDSATPGKFSGSITFLLNKCNRQVILPVNGELQQVQFTFADIHFPDLLGPGARPFIDTVITVTNTGDEPVFLTSIRFIPDTVFRVTEKRSNIYLLPGDTLQLRVEVQGKNCGLTSADLSATEYFCNKIHAKRYTVNVLTSLPLAIADLDFGLTCNRKDTVITIQNPNPYDVYISDVTINPTGPFSVTQSLFPIHLYSGSSTRIPVHFEPPRANSYSATAIIHTIPCGASSFLIRGSSGSTVPLFVDSALYFGHGCDISTQSRTVTIENASTRPIRIGDTNLIGSTRFSVVMPSLPWTLDAGSKGVLRIDYNPFINQKDDAVLKLLSPEGCLIDQLHISGSREIAQTEWASSGDIGSLCFGAPQSRTILLRNSGLDTVEIKTASVTGGSIVLDSFPKTIASGDVGKFHVTISGSPGQVTATLTVAVGGCGSVTSIPLTASIGPSPQLILEDTLLNFGSVQSGDSAQQCIQLMNPSCVPMLIDTSIFSLTIPSIGLGLQSISKLPKFLDSAHVESFCFKFKPTDHDTIDTTIQLASSTQMLHVLAVGLAPDIITNGRLLDFGYVVYGSDSVQNISLRNIGNENSQVLLQGLSDTNFHLGAQSILVRSNATVQIPIIYRPTVRTGMEQSMLYIRSSNRLDSILLKGSGARYGLEANVDSIDFGKVHLRSSLDTLIPLRATNHLPDTLRSIVIPPNTLSNYFQFRTSVPLPHIYTNPNDTVWLGVTFTPRTEETVTAALEAFSNLDTVHISLAGRGVEAHVKTDPDTLNFGNVGTGNSKNMSIYVTNIGEYPLNIFDVQSTSPVFNVSPFDTTRIIPAATTEKYQVVFTPSLLRKYSGLIRFVNSSPDSSVVFVMGIGVNAVQSSGSVVYSISNTFSSPGDHIEVPITIANPDHSLKVGDTISLVLAFDPSTVRLDGALYSQPRKDLPVSRVSDSVVLLRIPVSQIGSDSILAVLQTTTLLGARDTTLIRLVQSTPPEGGSILDVKGIYAVGECGTGYHGVSFLKGYVLNANTPNPVVHSTTIAYVLGAPGHVVLQVLDVLGRVVREVRDDDENAGYHSVRIDASELPNGRYVYILKSLEFRETRSFVVSH